MAKEEKTEKKQNVETTAGAAFGGSSDVPIVVNPAPGTIVARDDNGQPALTVGPSAPGGITPELAARIAHEPKAEAEQLFAGKVRLADITEEMLATMGLRELDDLGVSLGANRETGEPDRPYRVRLSVRLMAHGRNAAARRREQADSDESASIRKIGAALAHLDKIHAPGEIMSAMILKIAAALCLGEVSGSCIDGLSILHAMAESAGKADAAACILAARKELE